MKKTLNKIFILSMFSTISYGLDIDKHLELSYVQTSGNTNTSTFSTKFEATTKIDDKSDFRAKGSALYSENEDKTAANKYDVELDYNHMISEKTYAYMGTNYINDQLSDYDYRLNIGPGLGYKVLENENQNLDIQGGFDYAFDKYVNGKKDEYVAPRTELNYKYKFNENVHFKQMLNYLTSLEDTDKFFMASESSVGVKMTKNLSLGVSYRIDYVNETQKKNTDKKLLTSLILDF